MVNYAEHSQSIDPINATVAWYLLPTMVGGLMFCLSNAGGPAWRGCRELLFTILAEPLDCSGKPIPSHGKPVPSHAKPVPSHPAGVKGQRSKSGSFSTDQTTNAENVLGTYTGVTHSSIVASAPIGVSDTGSPLTSGTKRGFRNQAG